MVLQHDEVLAGPDRARWQPIATIGGAAVVAVLLGSWLGTVGITSGSGGPAVDSPVSPVALAILRLALDGAGIAAAGIALLPILLGAARNASRAVIGRTHRLTAIVGLGWALIALSALWLQAADAALVSPLRISFATITTYVDSVAVGRSLVLSSVCGLLLAMVSLTALGRAVLRGTPELAVGIAMIGLLSGPISGHASTHSAHDAAVLLIAVHVGAAAAWVGGLITMLIVIAPYRDLFATALPRFSAVAGVCLVLVTVTGVISAIIRLPSAGDLVATGYGLLIIAKSGCLVGLGLLGRRARRRLPELAVAGGRRLAVRFLLTEGTLMAVTVGLAAALSISAP